MRPAFHDDPGINRCGTSFSRRPFSLVPLVLVVHPSVPARNLLDDPVLKRPRSGTNPQPTLQRDKSIARPQGDSELTVLQPLGVHVVALELARAPGLPLLDALALSPSTLLVLVEHAV